MKHIKLFESFDGSDGAQIAAERQLEELMGVAFPDHEYANTGSGTVGDYELEDDDGGDGTKYVFANVYFTPDEFNKVQDEIDANYEEYQKKLEDLVEGVEIYDISSAPEDNMISISIAYSQNFHR